VRGLPGSRNDRISLHAKGNDEELKITVPGDPTQERQLWAAYWSFDEKPYPVGGIEIRCPSLPPPYDVIRYDVTHSGRDQILLGFEGPIFPAGVDLEFVLTGNSRRKELAVVIR
jgi:hypothetical protein